MASQKKKNLRTLRHSVHYLISFAVPDHTLQPPTYTSSFPCLITSCQWLSYCYRGFLPQRGNQNVRTVCQKYLTFTNWKSPPHMASPTECRWVRGQGSSPPPKFWLSREKSRTNRGHSEVVCVGYSRRCPPCHVEGWIGEILFLSFLCLPVNNHIVQHKLISFITDMTSV